MGAHCHKLKMKKLHYRLLREIVLFASISALSHLDFCIASRGYSTLTRSSRTISAFGDPKYFTDNYIPSLPSQEPGVMIKVPNFDVLFEKICKVSPLASQALNEDHPGGLVAIKDDADIYKWKIIDSFNPNRLIKEIDKIDGFEQKIPPIIRMRSTFHGPKKRRAETFSDVFSLQELRNQWDIANDVVDEIYSGNPEDLKQYQDKKYGKCSMIGIGYVRTKKSVVSPREQMTLCGVQNFPSGASIVWAVELEESQNHLFPNDRPKRVPRSTTHLFATTIIPTEDDETFDVEYVLQLEVGGFPGWLTGPVVIETVKKMFRWADDYFRTGLNGGVLAKKLALIPDEGSDNESINDVLDKKQALLMPP